MNFLQLLTYIQAIIRIASNYVQYVPLLLQVLSLVDRLHPSITMEKLITYVQEAENMAGMTGDQKKAYVLSKLGLSGIDADTAGILIDELIQLINAHSNK